MGRNLKKLGGGGGGVYYSLLSLHEPPSFRGVGPNSSDRTFLYVSSLSDEQPWQHQQKEILEDLGVTVKAWRVLNKINSRKLSEYPIIFIYYCSYLKMLIRKLLLKRNY